MKVKKREQIWRKIVKGSADWEDVCGCFSPQITFTFLVVVDVRKEIKNTVHDRMSAAPLLRLSPPGKGWKGSPGLQKDSDNHLRPDVAQIKRTK